MLKQKGRVLLVAGLVMAWSFPAAASLDRALNSTRDFISAALSVSPSDRMGVGTQRNGASEREVVAQAPDGHSEHHPAARLVLQTPPRCRRQQARRLHRAFRPRALRAPSHRWPEWVRAAPARVPAQWAAVWVR